MFLCCLIVCIAKLPALPSGAVAYVAPLVWHVTGRGTGLLPLFSKQLLQIYNYRGPDYR